MITELLNELGEARKKAAETYKAYKSEKEVEDSLREQLMVALKETGLKSAKNEDFMASIAERKNVVIDNETAVLEWLHNTPDIESDFYIGVKKPEFKTLANQMLKDTGELADGTSVEVTEYISIKSNKKG